MAATSIEQSKRLIELGIKAETADMYHNTNIPTDTLFLIPKEINFIYYEDSPLIPAWSTEKLLSILPKDILFDYNLEIFMCINYWCVQYVNPDTDEDLKVVKNKELLDAVYEMIIWLKENKYL